MPYNMRVHCISLYLHSCYLTEVVESSS